MQILMFIIMQAESQFSGHFLTQPVFLVFFFFFSLLLVAPREFHHMHVLSTYLTVYLSEYLFYQPELYSFAVVLTLLLSHISRV